MKRLLLTLGLMAGAVCQAATPAVPPLLPVDALFAQPAMRGLTFSPNGKYIACLVPHQGRMNVGLIDLEKMEKRMLTALKDRDIQSVSWANNERLVFFADPGGHENPFVYAIKRDGSEAVTLREGGDPAAGNQANARMHRVLGTLEDDPKHILVAAGVRDAEYPDVCKMNLSTGQLTVVVRNPGTVFRWVLDRDKNVRIGITRDRTHYTVIARGPDGGEWTTIYEYDDNTPHWEPLAFDGDGNTVYIGSDEDRATVGIYRYDLAKRQRGELVASDPVYDVANIHHDGNAQVIYDRSRKKVVGFSYVADVRKTIWIDDERAAFQQKLDASLPGYQNTVVAISENGERLLIASSNDRDAGVYSLFDARTKRIDELAVLLPNLDPEHMAPMKPITFKARDGFVLHGYLTLPVGRPARNLPLVIHPHGGPYGPRDEWGFNPEVQFYANRGYAVLQVNFRGSGGYGLAFMQAGYKRWGLEMQNDLTDGVKWAIAEGVADPARVVISGASYGGYATMAGLAYTPELYAAGINYVGVTDLSLIVPKGMSPRVASWRKSRIADPDKGEDRRRMEATSPINAAERIRAPLLMGYGKNDPRVNIEHCYVMERALKRAGKRYELVIQENEGHGFRESVASIDFYRRVDTFLAQYVPSETRVSVGPTSVIELPAKTPTGAANQAN